VKLPAEETLVSRVNDEPGSSGREEAVEGTTGGALWSNAEARNRGKSLMGGRGVKI